MSKGGVIDVVFAGTRGGFQLDAAFRVPARGVTALFGPSGCGKTTILRAVAGLERFERGRLVVAGEVWQDKRSFRPPHRRAVGYVFQEASLFPHLSVRGNLLYGHRRAGNGAIGLKDVVAMLGLERLLERPPHVLSGGERQRVAIGRALLAQPRLLLMDEPLAALDQTSKAEILPYLEALHDRLAIPVLYVSHDMAEVERLADHVVLLGEGRVRAVAPLEELTADVALPWAQTPQAGAVLPATVEGFDGRYALSTLAVPGGRLLVPGRAGSIGGLRRVKILARDVSLARRPPEESSILNLLPARIVSQTPLDDAQALVLLRLGEDGGGGRLLARITRRSWDVLALAPGEPVFAQVKSVALIGRQAAAVPPAQ